MVGETWLSELLNPQKFLKRDFSGDGLFELMFKLGYWE